MSTTTSPATLPSTTPTEPRPAGSPLTGPSDDRLVISVEEAAQRLDIGRTLFFELIRAGRIRTIRVGRLPKVPVESLRDFVERQSISETTEPR